MAPRALFVTALLLAALAGCDSASEPGTRDERARLSQLGLTTTIPSQVKEACAEARRLATVRVLCPLVIPNVRITKMKGSFGSIVFDAEPRVYMLNFDKDFFGSTPPPPGVRHWIAGSGKASIVEKWILTDFANEVEGDAELLRTEQVRGHEIRIYAFPRYPAGGVNGSHVGAFVQVGDEIVFASLHGSRYEDAAVEMAVSLAEQVANAAGNR